MLTNRFFWLVPLVLLTVLAACNTEHGPVTPQNATVVDDAVTMLKVGRGTIWADCELFGTVATPTSFEPGQGPFDDLYVTGNFKDGVNAVSESKPGDQDWNGGRWRVLVLKEGVDPAKYADVCSDAGIDHDDFESNGVYFECPLLPRRGMNKVGRGMIWGDCELFATVATPTSFEPGQGPFDDLYNVALAGGSFKDGVGAISESVPGDRDWNGGRWRLLVLKEGVNPMKYADACSDAELDHDDFESNGVYFECPMLPRRGKGHQ